MEERLANVKKYIISLLTASPLAMTMIQLNKDYRNTIGEPIPYQKLGYNSLEHLLKSIPDTLRVRGTGPMAELLPVLSEKSCHVMEMVSSQKKPTPKKRDAYYGNRTVVIAPMARHKPSVQPQTQNKPQKIFYPKPNNALPPPNDGLPTPHCGLPTPNKGLLPTPNKGLLPTPAKSSNSSTVISKPPVSYTTYKPTVPTSAANKNIRHENKPNNFVKKENVVNNNVTQAPHSSIKGRINNIFQHSPSPNGNQKTVDELKGDESKEVESRSPGSFRRRSCQVKKVEPPTENQEHRVPDVIRNNLKRMISLYPEGIWCAKVPELYRNMFKTDLKYQELGFNNLIDLCLVLESIFHYVRPSSDDFKLYDRSKPLPKCAEQSFTIASYSNGISSEVEGHKALPSIEWTDLMNFLPPGTFNPGREIPRAFISDYTRENDCIDVVVGEIYDLSKFWVYTEVDELNRLMDDMQLFYKNNYLQYFMTKQLIREGVYCVQIIFGEYHRALIVDLTPLHEDMIRVIFIDYGTMAKVPIKDLCFLHEQFSLLPAQAIRCRLANICPAERGAPWSRESSRAFRNLIRKRNLTAKISRIQRKDQFLEVCLADTTDENNVFYINDRLVEMGFAVHTEKDQKESLIDSISKPLVNYIHLFPTFTELEHGLAPSTGEMEILYDCNVPINFCYPQYFFTDTTDEEKIIEHAVAFHENHCLKGLRESSMHTTHCIDRSKTHLTPLNFSIFGSLEAEIREFYEAKDVVGTDEEFVDAIEAPSEEDIAKISERLDVLRSQTVDELRKDCLLSEDIMNEILSICDSKRFLDSPKSTGIYPDVTTEADASISQGRFLKSSHCSAKDQEEVYVDRSAASYDSRLRPDVNTEADESLTQGRYLKSYCSSAKDQEELCIDRSAASYDSRLRPDVNTEADESLTQGRYLKRSHCSAKDQEEVYVDRSGASYDTRLRPDVSTEADEAFGNGRFLNSRSSGSKDRERYSDVYDLRTVKAELRVPDISPDVTSEAEVINDIEASLEGCKKTGYSSTNPFLSDLLDSAEETNNLPTLNRNNPFLSYLKNQAEDNKSDNSEGSSGSTVYGTYVEEETAEKHWSTRDDVSDGVSLSSLSTTTNESKPMQMQLAPPATPYCSPYAYAEWHAGLNNPYYRARFANFGLQQQAYFPPMVPRYGFGPQVPSPVRLPAVCPPPGFGPIPQAMFSMAANMAAGQYNCVSRTSVSVAGDRDFYEMYNERLRMELQRGAND